MTRFKQVITQTRLAGCGVLFLWAANTHGQTDDLASYVNRTAPIVECVATPDQGQICTASRIGVTVTVPGDWAPFDSDKLKDRGFMLNKKDSVVFLLVLHIPNGKFDPSNIKRLATDYQFAALENPTWGEPRTMKVAGRDVPGICVSGAMKNKMNLKMCMSFVAEAGHGVYLVSTAGTPSEMEAQQPHLESALQTIRIVPGDLPKPADPPPPVESGMPLALTTSRGKITLRFPAEWEEAKQLSAASVLSAQRKDERGFLLTFIVDKRDYDDDITLATYAERSAQENIAGMVKGESDDPVRLKVGGWPALQYHIRGNLDSGLKLEYLRTYIDTGKYFVVIAAWATRSNFEELAEEFKSITASAKSAE